MTLDPYEIALTVIGLAALVAAWAPTYLQRRPLSLPVILVGAGALMFALPLPFRLPDPRTHLEVVERATELGVIVSLMGAGLKIDRPFNWRTWSTTWRMLAIAMPVTIALTAVAGATLGGLGALAAFLLGAVLAPTDPVLASDVQVGEPTLDEPVDPTAEEDVRFTLTSEGGLNDALAFPFVYAAISAAKGDGSDWVLGWFAWDVLGRIAIGLAAGWLVGRLLGLVAFRPPLRLSALAETKQGFVAIAATLLAYGFTELLQGYGFLAVFVAAVTLRSSERDHEFHAELHGFSEQVENLLVVGLLLVFGGSLVIGVLDQLTIGGVAVALAVVFLIRPMAGHLALVGTDLTVQERWAIAFFGIRGFGTIYYLAYALSETRFPQSDGIWAIVALALVVSIGVHGVTATPMMRMLDRTVGRRSHRGPVGGAGGRHA